MVHALQNTWNKYFPLHPASRALSYGTIEYVMKSKAKRDKRGSAGRASPLVLEVSLVSL